MKATNNYEATLQSLDQQLRVQENFDIVKRQLFVDKVRFTFYFVDGFIKDEVIEKMMEFFLKTKVQDALVQLSSKEFADSFIPYVEVEVQKDLSALITSVLSGSLLLMVEGIEEGIIIDVRTYPTRGMSEPEDDKVLRGSRDGFVETLIFNTALIRRRIRDTDLRMEYHSVGKASKSDLVLCYMEHKVDKEALAMIQKRLAEIDVEALTMAHESLSEALVKNAWYNPFPKVRYTERPDTAASNILEGKIVLLLDNSPSALILPTHFFDFVQEAQDYYLPPCTGVYLRCIRILVFLVTLLITPLWYYINSNPDLAPSFLQFTLIPDTLSVPILIQFLLLEFGIDALKLASLNTPSSLNSSFSIIGALILGDFAVNAGWFAPEVILYMAFVALANFTQPSYELGYAIKFMRVMLLILIGLFPRYGLFFGILFLLFILYSNKTITKTSYLYPLIPFNAHDFKMIFIRKKLRSDKTVYKK